MTEEEAKTKWCPMVRMHPSGYNASTHDDGTPDQRYGRCIGSACMAWRQFSFTPYREVWQQTSGGSWYTQRCEMSPEEMTTPGGYCGLAGKP